MGFSFMGLNAEDVRVGLMTQQDGANIYGAEIVGDPGDLVIVLSGGSDVCFLEGPIDKIAAVAGEIAALCERAV